MTMEARERKKRADIRPHDHEERMAVARRVAGWELGSGSWADRLISAYLWPDEARENLNRDRGLSDGRHGGQGTGMGRRGT